MRKTKQQYELNELKKWLVSHAPKKTIFLEELTNEMFFKMDPMPRKRSITPVLHRPSKAPVPLAEEDDTQFVMDL